MIAASTHLLQNQFQHKQKLRLIRGSLPSLFSTPLSAVPIAFEPKLLEGANTKIIENNEFVFEQA